MAAHVHMLAGVMGGLRDNDMQAISFRYNDGDVCTGVAHRQFKSHRCAEEYVVGLTRNEELHDGRIASASREQELKLVGNTGGGAGPPMCLY